MEPRYRGRHSDLGLELPSHTNNSHEKSRSLRPTSSSSRYHSYQQPQQQRDLFPKRYSVPIVLVFVILSYSFCRYMDSRLPTPLTVGDVESNPKSFIEERARNDLLLLTGLGPRVCGSHANDIAAVELLIRTIREIDRTKEPVHSIEIDIQKPSGAFYMEFQEGLTSSYASVPLVIAKLEPKFGSVNSSVLVNCHFDSVPGSPGASDDAISCAAMLEILRVLSAQKKPLRNAIIFLFNGAEENGMQASHGFVAGRMNTSSELGHPWIRSKPLKAFLNLEASGAGGREVLFQTGPGNGWILNAYAKVPYPYGSVVGEEIFQRGLIPSDTDFRVFRDHAKIPGLDMAFIKNGWVYHTRFDSIDEIPPGSIQHLGSNSLAILEYLGNLDFLSSDFEYTDEKMVYFDIFGLYMAIYSETFSTVINIVIAVATIYFAWLETNGDGSQILLYLVANLLGWILSVVCPLIVAVLLNVAKYYAPFFSYPSLAIPLFGIPAVVAQVWIYSIVLSGQEDQSWIAGKTGLAFTLLAFSFTSRAMFSITIHLAFGLLGWITARKFFSKDPRKKLLYYLAVGEAVPLAMSFYLINSFLDVFGPIMGRSGSQNDPNIFMAVLTSIVITFPSFTGLIAIFVLFRKTFYRISAAIFFLTMLVVAFVIGKIPYQEKTPMRLHIVEVDRIWYDRDLTTVARAESGFWFFNIDPNVKEMLPLLFEEHANGQELIDSMIDVNTDTCEDLYCGLPYYFPVSKLVKKTQWLPKPQGLPLDMKGRVRMDLIHDSYINNVRRLTLSFIGPDHMTIVLSPGEDWILKKWSLTQEMSPGKAWRSNRVHYFVYHGRGINFERFEFTLELEKKPQQQRTSSFSSSNANADNQQQQTGAALDITYSCFWLHGSEMKSDSIKDFIVRFPEWTYTLAFSSVANMYSIQ